MSIRIYKKESLLNNNSSLILTQSKGHKLNILIRLKQSLSRSKLQISKSNQSLDNEMDNII